LEPPFRLISRLTVEGERPSNLAIDRTDRCAATPLEITSRSASVNASLERRRWAGRIPPCGMLQAIQWRPWADEQVYGLAFLQGKGVKISNPASEAASRDRDPSIQRRLGD